MTETEQIINEIEMLTYHFEDNAPTRAVNQRTLLERRWQAYKFIKIGIKTEEENKKALELIDKLMTICNSKHENDKDRWLLGKLAKVVADFEEKTYK